MSRSGLGQSLIQSPSLALSGGVYPNYGPTDKWLKLELAEQLLGPVPL